MFSIWGHPGWSKMPKRFQKGLNWFQKVLDWYQKGLNWIKKCLNWFQKGLNCFKKVLHTVCPREILGIFTDFDQIGAKSYLDI